MSTGQTISNGLSKAELSIGISTLFKPRDPLGALKNLFSAGLKVPSVEIALADRIPLDQASGIKNLGRKEGVDFSVHSPFLLDDIAHPHRGIRRIYLEEVKKTIDFANQLGGKIVNIHPGQKAIQLPEIDVFSDFPYSKEVYMENARKSLREIIDYAQKRDITIAVENITDGVGKSPEEIDLLLSGMEGTIFNLDVGHANITDNLKEFLDLPLGHLHLHDNKGREDLHQPPGRGTVDFSMLRKSLLEKEFEGQAILELYSIQEIREGLEHLKSLRWF